MTVGAGANPGPGWTKKTASTLYGWYTGLAYLFPIFGGIIADKLIGTHRSMVVGGLLIAIGHVVLQLLGISVGAFTLAGGVIIFLIALKMVLGPSGGDVSGSGPSDGSFAIVPLAIPLLAGPGPISSVIVYASKGVTGQGASLGDDLVLAGIILVVALATFLSLAVADPARRLLGDTGINVFTRISGILVAAIAVGLVNEGLGTLYPQLAGSSP